MKKKSIIIAVVIIVVALIIAAIATISFLVVKDLEQEGNLKTEIMDLSKVVETVPVDTERYNEKINRVITSGDYAIVEKACKDYIQQLYDNVIQITELLNSDEIVKILTAENYQQDGPDFVKTTLWINQTRDKVEEAKNKYVEDMTEEHIMSYIKDKISDEYYIDLYKQIMIGNEENILSEDTEQVEQSLNTIIDILNTQEKIINYLKENKGRWQIENGTIAFTTEELTNEYNNMLLELQ